MKAIQKQRKILFVGLAILVLVGTFHYYTSLLDWITPVFKASELQSLVPIKNDSVVKVSTNKEMAFDDEELESYYAVYSDPFVNHLRKALDGYLAGTNVGIDSPEVVVEKSTFDNETLVGLASFDRRYYESKFSVLSLHEALFGGREIVLVFQDKPDRIFTAWVYKYGNENRYDLRGFWENKEATKNLDRQLERYEKYIFDREHSL